MIVPGTTIAVSLLPGYVELRDRGIVKQKVKVKNRSFDEVAQDVEEYFRQRGKRLAPSVIRDTLVRIGLPQVRVILAETPPAETVKPARVVERPPMIETSTPTGVVSPAPTRFPPMKAQPAIVAEIPVISSAVPVKETTPSPPIVEPVVKGGVSLETRDFQDIETALSAVEHLSDSFMASAHEMTSESVGKIGIKLKGADEVIASSKTHSASQTAATNAVDEAVVAPAPTVGIARREGTSAVPAVAGKSTKTPAHVVKPLVKAKALILGEDTVGKHTLLTKAGFALVEDLPYLFTRMFELEDYRVNLSVWCFDDAVKAKVSRKEFYKQADVVVVVYSASDRWSYDSLEFWLKEASIAMPKMPPVVIVANKKDQRVAEPLSDRQPVTTEEGFAYAETLAAKLGVDEHLHPVAFIETSSLTSEGVVDVFRTAAELYVSKGMLG